MRYAGIIYLITNNINGKRYIGLTTRTMEERWRQHVYDARHDNQYPLHRAMRKYGIENFSIKQIDEAQSLEELKEKEQYWIKTLDTYSKEYNATHGGDTQTRSSVGYVKINIITGEIEETYQSAKECNLINGGGSATQKADKITQTQYVDYVIVKAANLEGKTPEEIKKYAFSLRPKIICQILNGKTVNRWLNSTDLLTNYPEITKSCVFDCLHGRRKTHLGFEWKYYCDTKDQEE